MHCPMPRSTTAMPLLQGTTTSTARHTVTHTLVEYNFLMPAVPQKSCEGRHAYAHGQHSDLRSRQSFHNSPDGLPWRMSPDRNTGADASWMQRAAPGWASERGKRMHHASALTSQKSLIASARVLRFIAKKPVRTWHRQPRHSSHMRHARHSRENDMR